jgi:GDPmannose 4,6-dehydratase
MRVPSAARIKLGLQDCLYIGNLNARRDWGHARDYIEMMWLMLQQEKAEDFVIATGIQHSVRDFVNMAAGDLGMNIRWKGEGVDETGVLIHASQDKNSDRQPEKVIIRVDPRYFRPTEVDSLLGDSTKARKKLGWTSRTSFEDLVAEMVREDLKAAERDELIKRHGYSTFDYHE